MGASKTHQYTVREIQAAKIANALGHPARLKILKILNRQGYSRNIDLVNELHLVRSTVNSHLMKLFSAGLIDLEFCSNCYHIKPNLRAMEKITIELEEAF